MKRRRKRRNKNKKIFAVLLVCLALTVTAVLIKEKTKSFDVYISPSKQVDNEYAAGDTTEAEQMYLIGERVCEILEDRGISVYMPDVNSDSLSARVDQAKRYKAKAYVAIHSNAGGGEGTECFYNENSEESRSLAENVYSRAASVTPTEDRGLKSGNKANLYEATEPTCASCLVEVEFHDDEDKAIWITEHTEELAVAVADGITEYLH